jgi:hypothetical protein
MKLLIYSCADGVYTQYVELWKYSIRKSYPEYSFDCYQSDMPMMSNCLRFIIGLDNYFDYFYITDIDCMIMKDPVSILDFHLNEMKETGLCYSNTIRKSEPQGNDRLTGLHFCNKEWYEKTEKARLFYYDLIKNGKIGAGLYDDEIMLKNIVLESGLKLPPKKYPLIKRHHSIHIGTIRHYIGHSRETMNHQLSMRISKDYAKQWISYYEDKEFLDIIKRITDKQIIKMLDILHGFCMRMSNSGVL